MLGSAVARLRARFGMLQARDFVQTGTAPGHLRKHAAVSEEVCVSRKCSKPKNADNVDHAFVITLCATLRHLCFIFASSLFHRCFIFVSSLLQLDLCARNNRSRHYTEERSAIKASPISWNPVFCRGLAQCSDHGDD